MEPTAASVAAARSIGKIGAAAINHYKPTGVARVGSAEDRAQAYRRLLDATVQHRLALSYVEALKASPDSRHPLFVESARHMMATGAEINCALQGVQLCAPYFVIRAAQNVVDAVPVLSEEGSATYQTCQVEFLNAARYDLDYNPKRWQIWKRRKSRKFAAQPPLLQLQSR